VLLSKPFWIWGAEMGSNEFGVTVGNEAVFTRIPYEKTSGLIGMDFLRLALERSRTALQAMETIIQLLEKYGQGGNCGYAHPFFYHNSFLICDLHEAWVLETAGREWVAEKVTDIRSISNGLTIENKWDRASQGLVKYAVDKGWCKSETEFNFKRCYSDPVYTFFADSQARQSCTTDSLREKIGKLTVKDMMKVLRIHTVPAKGAFTPGKGLMGADICMHAGWGPIRASQSAGSMVSALREKGTIHWLTGTAAPCTSTFKPIWMDAGIPLSVKAPGKDFDETTLFWNHEALHREILKDYAARIPVVTDEREALEAQFLEQADQVGKDPESVRLSFSKACFDKVTETERVWLQKVKNIHIKSRNAFYYDLAWKELNRVVGMPN
jgi:secernin